MRRGFSLMELSIVLMITGIAVGGYFKFVARTGNTGIDCKISTQKQLATIKDALDRYARSNERFPFPARRYIGVESAAFGREVDAAHIGSLNSVSGAYWGALPFVTLGLPQTFGGDCWGNQFTYVITGNLTGSSPVGGYRDPNQQGALTVNNAENIKRTTTMAYAVISHGEDQLGAIKTGYSSSATPPDKNWCSGTTIKYTNCAASGSAIIDAAYNNGKDAGTAYFDDIVIASGKPQMAPGAPCTLPWGGSILHNQSITAYQLPSEPTCHSEIRTCNNGTLSGSYINSSCTASVAAVNGACNSCNSMMACGGGTYTCDTNGCSQGTQQGYTTNTTVVKGVSYTDAATWQCAGINGGTTATCSETIPIPDESSTCQLPPAPVD